MIVGTVEIRLAIREARSLKDKRRVIASIKDHIRQKFNVSIAEVDAQDLIQSATLGAAQVSNDSRYVNSTLESLVGYLRRFPAAQMIDYRIEIL